MNGEPATESPQICLRVTDPIIFPLVRPDVRPQVALLWELDARLAQLAHAGKEPALRQIRLRWWADQLAGLTAENGSPEPLLANVASGLLPFIPAGDLADLAEQWMAMAAVDDGESVSAGPGGVLFHLTAGLIGHPNPHLSARAGRGWGQVVELLHRGSTDEDGWAEATANLSGLGDMPRALAALAGAARSVARRRGQRRRGVEQLLVLRIGLFGR